MRTREKSKLDMSKTDNPSDVASRREVSVQDNPCTVTPQEVSQSRPEPMTVMLKKLISAVDGVSSKIGTIETRLTLLEGEVRNSGDSDCYVSGIQPAVGEPLFGPQAVGGARPKIKKSKPVGSDIETLECDIDSKQRKKKKQDKKGVHTVKAMPQEYVQQLSKYTDKTIIERKKKPTDPLAGTLHFLGPARRRLPFDDLNMTQFVMGFIKNVNDTLDSLTRQYMLAELYDLMKLADSTSWPVAKGAFISSMHSIEDGEIAWSDRSALLQRRMTQTHATMFATQSVQRTPAGRPKDTGSDRKLFCKFFPFRQLQRDR